MVNHLQEELAVSAERLYATAIRSKVEPEHDGEFVAIEPVSGEFFLGKTLSAAVQAARHRFPERMTYVMRIGIHPAVMLGSW